MFIFLDSDINKKLIKVKMSIDTLQVDIRGTSFIDGKWKNKINAEDTYWTIEDG